MSALASYDVGPLSVRYAYETHLDYFGLSWLGGSPGVTLTNPNSRDDGHEIVAWVTLPTGTRLAAIAERLTYRTDEMTPGLVNSYQRDAILGAVQQRIGEHTLWGSFGYAGAGRCTMAGGGPCTTNGLDGRQWSVGYTFSPAKTVDIYASFYELANGRSGTHALFPLVVPIAPGIDHARGRRGHSLHLRLHHGAWRAQAATCGARRASRTASRASGTSLRRRRPVARTSAAGCPQRNG